MAKDLNRSIKIYIDHSDAMKKSTDFSQKIDVVKQKLEELSNQGKKGSPEYKAQEENLRKLEASYDRYKTKLTETERILKNLSGATRGELEALRKELKKSLKNAARDTEEYAAKVQALVAVEEQLNIIKKEQNGTLGENGTLWSRAANGFNKYFGIITSAVAGITGLSFALHKLAEDLAKMDDVYADVMKTTGMTRDQVIDLNKEFKKMDTRTSREELNNLAADAGKLGLTSKQDILDFVEAGNQINVALGEDLGEGAIKNIGKITDVFKQSTRELAGMDIKGRMLAVGSAINELGATSSASEPYLVSFTGRLGGIAAQANISLQNILGFGSALDQNMQAVEMSATAFQKLIMSMLSEPAKFAQIAEMSLKDFNKLLKEDTNEALLTVLEKLGGKGGLQALIPVFKDMGLDAARAAQVVSSLAGNVDKIREAQNTANQAFSEGTSLTKEYTTKNNNLQAQLEKARKEFKDAALDLGEKLNPALMASTNFMTYIVKVLPGLIDWFSKYKGVIITVTSAIIAYTVATNASVIAKKLAVFWNTKILQSTLVLTAKEKLHALSVGISTLATYAKGLAHDVLTKKITLSYAANEAFRISLMKTPWGLVIAAITATIVGLSQLAKKAGEAKTATDLLTDANNEAAKSIAGERAEVNLLLSVAKNEKISKEERLKAIKRLNEISPEYLGYLNLENINTQAATDSLKKYTEELFKSAKARSALKRIQDDTDKMFDLDDKIAESRKEIEALQKEISDVESEPMSLQVLAAKLYIKDHQKKIEGYENEKKALEDNIKVYSEYHQKLLDKPEPKNTFNDTLLAANEQLDKLEQAHAEAYNKIEESKKNIFYSDGEKMADNMRLKSLSDQIAAQKELIKQKELSVKAGSGDDSKPEPPKPENKPTSSGGNTDNTTENPELKKLNEQEKAAKMELLKAYADRKKTKEQYEQELTDIEAKYINKRFELTGLDAKTREEIDKAYYDLKIKLKEKEDQNDATRLSVLENEKDLSLQIIDGWFNEEKKKLTERNLSQKEYSLEMQLLELSSSEIRLAILQRFSDDSTNLEIQDGKLKADTARKAGEEIVKAETDVIARRKDLQKTYQESEKSVREKYDLETFRERKQQELTALDELHRLGLISEDTYQRALLEIEKKYEKEQRQVRKQWGIETIGEEYKQELELLREHHKQGLLSESEYQLALYSLKVNYAKKYADQFTKTTGGMFSALAEAETAKLDAEYDVRIEAAKGNAEEVERLEKEKAQKKLDIEKKYADVQFAVKASEIIANTAVAIMTGYRQLGPIAGHISAAMLAVTGAAQLAAANAERQKVKNMTLSGSGSGGGSRRVVSQQAKGKYDVIGEDDGKLYKNVPYTGSAKTGMVYTPTLVGESGGELVVSSPDLRALQKHVNYPLIVQAINDVRSGTVPQQASGKYDSLGNTGSTTADSKAIQELSKAVSDMKAAVETIKKIKAEVNMNEFAQKKSILDDFNEFGKKQ